MVGNVAELRKPVGDSLSENRCILGHAAHLLCGVLVKVVNIDYRLLVGPYLPHFLIFCKFLLVLNADLILLHRFLVVVSPFPHFAVLVIQNSVVARFGKRVF